MEFKKYNGEENFPTWSMNLIVSNDSDTREDLQQIAQRGSLEEAVVDVRHYIETMVEEWWYPLLGEDTYVSPFVKTFMGAAIRDSIREANWTLIRDSLAKKNHIEKDDEINYAILMLYRTLLNWRKVAKEYLHKQENREISSGGVLQEIALQDTLYDALDEWIESSKLRAMPLYALNDYARKIYTVWTNAIDWKRIARALRGESVK